jgi:hypothetical protein
MSQDKLKGNTYRILERKPRRIKLLGKPRNIEKDTLKIYVKEIGWD